MNTPRFKLLPMLALLIALAPAPSAQHAVPREWNELLLDSIRGDFARPTVHARNLYHISTAMYDAWATYDPTAETHIFPEDHATTDPMIDTWREEAMSYAAYKLLKQRFRNSPGFAVNAARYDQMMIDLGYDPMNSSTVGNSPSAIGNRIGAGMLAFGLADNSNEPSFENLFYEPLNPPLIVALPGNPDIISPNRWQPLALDFFIDQSGNPIPGGSPPFLGPEWGIVTPFALTGDDLTINNRDGFDYWVFHDPGAPPYNFNGSPTLADYQWGFEMVVTWSSHLDSTDPTTIDISPASIGNAPMPAGPSEYDQFYDFFNGGDWGQGHTLNPATGMPYPPNVVKRGDYGRILAEFWADGPDSETPPGHWFTIMNYVADHPDFERRLQGKGPIVDEMEWYVKSYMLLGGTMHDCAVSAWGVKGWYDYLRPVSAIRYMADQGQASNNLLPNYNARGLRLYPDYIELVTAATTLPGEKHEHLAGSEGKIAINAWRGPDFINDPDVDEAGVGWILAENWWPYQRPTFVTPPFAGYVSGHSTFSRAAAVVMDRLTGSAFFPGGVGEFEAPMNEFLVFEEGPSESITLEWATYYDASDQTSLSRIWGGIHPPADDIPGRLMGQQMAEDAWDLAVDTWNGPWADLENGLAGTNGVPYLQGGGALAGNDPIQISLSGARENATAYLVVGFQAINLPFYGGTLVPDFQAPNGLFVNLTTNGTGDIEINNTWPTGVPSGFELYLQYWIDDPGAIAGLAASNAVVGTTP